MLGNVFFSHHGVARNLLSIPRMSDTCSENESRADFDVDFLCSGWDLKYVMVVEETLQRCKGKNLIFNFNPQP